MDSTRQAMLVEAQAAYPADVAAALRLPGTPDWMIDNGFAVPDDLAELAGPGDGEVDAPPEWNDLPARLTIADAAQCSALYLRVLTNGRPDQARALLNAEVLIKLWTQLAPMLPAAITQVWQGRFPQLNPERNQRTWTTTAP
jgi:hypothetical protein